MRLERDCAGVVLSRVPVSWDQADLTDDYCARREIAPRQTFAGFQTGPAEGTVADAMSEPLRRTIVSEDAGDGDGWVVVARIPQVGAQSAGAQPDEAARENVIGTLRGLLAARFAARAARPHRQRLARVDACGLKSMAGESRPVAEKR